MDDLERRCQELLQAADAERAKWRRLQRYLGGSILALTFLILVLFFVISGPYDIQSRKFFYSALMVLSCACLVMVMIWRQQVRRMRNEEQMASAQLEVIFTAMRQAAAKDENEEERRRVINERYYQVKSEFRKRLGRPYLRHHLFLIYGVTVIIFFMLEAVVFDIYSASPPVAADKLMLMLFMAVLAIVLLSVLRYLART